MKTLKIKHSEASKGRLSLQNSNAKLGLHNGVITLEITDIPDVISSDKVLSIAHETTFWAKRDSFKFSELGPGKIIR